MNNTLTKAQIINEVHDRTFRKILGPDVRIVTFEFDRWRSHNGQPEKDRLDMPVMTC